MSETHQVVVSGILAGQFVQNVFAFHGACAADGLQYERSLKLIEYLNTEAWLAAFLAAVPEDYTATSLRAHRVLDAGGPTAILTGGSLSATSGGRSGQIQAAQVNPVVVWIPRDHPSKTGRTFLPGASEDDIDQMVLTADLVTAINAFIAAHTGIASIDGFTGDVQGCLYRRRRVLEDETVIPASFDYIDYGQLSPVIGTQRRRLHPV